MTNEIMKRCPSLLQVLGGKERQIAVSKSDIKIDSFIKRSNFPHSLYYPWAIVGSQVRAILNLPRGDGLQKIGFVGMIAGVHDADSCAR